MSRRRSRTPEERLCCSIAEQLAAAEAAAPHLRAAKRELLQFVRSLVEAELARMDDEDRRPRAGRKRKVAVRGGAAPGGTR